MEYNEIRNGSSDSLARGNARMESAERAITREWIDLARKLRSSDMQGTYKAARYLALAKYRAYREADSCSGK